MVEIVVGLVVGTLAGAAARVYVRYLHKDSVRTPEFEAWARGRPLVAAALCRVEPGPSGVEHGLAHRCASELRTLLGDDHAVCDAGKYPWTRYALELGVEHPTRRVVTVRLRAARLRRVHGAPRDLLDVLRDLARACPYLEALWVHGELHQDALREAVDRSRFGWLARRDQASGELVLTPMIGAPAWLRAAASDP